MQWVSIDSDSVDSIYNNLIKANEEVALSTLPKKPKLRKYPINADANVATAREHLRDISSRYHANPSRTNKDKVAAAKTSLDTAYFDAEVAFVNGKIDEISYLHINQRHSAAWKTENELSGEGSKPATTLKGVAEKNVSKTGIHTSKIFSGSQQPCLKMNPFLGSKFMTL